MEVYQFIFPSVITRDIYSSKYDCFPTSSLVIKHFDFCQLAVEKYVLIVLVYIYPIISAGEHIITCWRVMHIFLNFFIFFSPPTFSF